MRVLKFIVNDQIITKDPSCDFSGLVPGTDRYLQAEFEFSPEWDECVRVATFFSPMGKEYAPQLLAGGKTCIIPTDALAKRTFSVKVVGKGKYTITTNKVVVEQNGGN